MSDNAQVLLVEQLLVESIFCLIDNLLWLEKDFLSNLKMRED
jgi:hypothetical protein